MSPRPRRTEQTNNLAEVIKETALRHIAQNGASALSLRAIARDLNITAPAIYNYFPDRDALITALIVDAYTSFGDWQLNARDALPESDPVGRMHAIGAAYRAWALAYPQRYQLIFGTPMPGYNAPMQQVLPAAARSLSALVSVVDALRQAGRLQITNFPAVQEAYLPAFEMWKAYGGNYDTLTLSVAILVWARVHGLVSLEIGNNLPPFGPDGGALYEYELQTLQRQFLE